MIYPPFKVSVKSPHKICQRLSRVETEFNYLQAKLGYVPKHVFTVSLPWKIVRHILCSLMAQNKQCLFGVQINPTGTVRLLSQP